MREDGELGWHFRHTAGHPVLTIAKKESRVESGNYETKATLVSTAAQGFCLGTVDGTCLAGAGHYDGRHG